MATCKNCGNRLHKDDLFCEKCGKKVYSENEYTQEIPVYFNQSDTSAQGQDIHTYSAPVSSSQTENKTLGAWAFFGYSILFIIPIIGLICNLIFCFNSSNITRRNYARSYWCWYVIIAIAAIVIIASGISLPYLFF